MSRGDVEFSPFIFLLICNRPKHFFISIWKVDLLINIDWKAKLDSGRNKCTEGEGFNQHCD